MEGQLQADRAARDGELFRLLAENVQDYAIFVIDPDGRVLNWTSGAKRLLGYEEEEILGRPASLFFTPEDIELGLPEEVMQQSLGTGRGEDDRWHVRKDGSRFFCSGVMTPLRDEWGMLQGFAKIMRDRTDWWHALQDRREGEVRKAAILEAALDCIITVDHEGNIVEFNPAAEQTFGYKRSEVLGREMTELIIPPSFRDEHRRGMTHYLATGIGRVLGRRIEVNAMRADGTELLVELTITKIPTGGSPVFTAFLRDISERRRQEEEITERRLLADFGRDIALALTESGSLVEMLARAVEETVRHLDGALARIWTVNEAGDMLNLRASAGLSPDLDGPADRIPFGESRIGVIAQERRPVLLKQVIPGSGMPSEDRPKREELVAFAGYPLIVEDRLVGVWAVFSHRAFSEVALGSMAAVADGLAGGIERMRAEARLREQQEWLQVTLDSIGDAVISTDDQGRVKFLNPVAEGLTGWSQGEAIGKPIDDVFQILHENTRRPAENPVHRVLREGVVIGLANHTVVVARDGTETAIEDSAAPIWDGHDNVVGVVMVFQDATERRRNELEVEASRRFLASSIDALTAQIAVLDVNGMILMVNEAWRRFATVNAYPHSSGGVGINYLEVCGTGDHDGDGRRAANGIESVLNGQASSFEIEYPCHGPSDLRWFLMRATRFESASSVNAVVAHEEITERKQAEEHLRAAKDEAEQANRAKDQFLAVLSHELRTPLNPILLAATAMLERPPALDELSPALEMICQNVNLQARLIDDLLDVMRIVRGKMPLHWEVADAHALIRQAVAVCQSEVFGKELRLEMLLEAEGQHLNADPARFQQVIWNLVKNAVKFTPRGGTITIRTDNRVIEGDERLVIKVSDTGIGIDLAVLPLIFDPFQQGETRITRKFGGLGLGLAICRGIVDAHGGTLVVESAGKDRGTAFCITMKTIPGPTVTGVVPKRDTSASLPTATSSLKVLVVEDEPATLRLMARLMSGLGHVVTTAGTVADALDALGSVNFDLIVSDIGLPDASGLELIRQIVARIGPVPAIALTGYGMEEDILRSREAGFTAHLTKPIDFTKLEAMIRQVTN